MLDSIYHMINTKFTLKSRLCYAKLSILPYIHDVDMLDSIYTICINIEISQLD